MPASVRSTCCPAKVCGCLPSSSSCSTRCASGHLLRAGLALPERTRVRHLLVAVSTLVAAPVLGIAVAPALNGLIGAGPERIAVVGIAGIETTHVSRGSRLHYYARLDEAAASLPPGVVMGRYDEAWSPPRRMRRRCRSRGFRFATGRACSVRRLCSKSLRPVRTRDENGTEERCAAARRVAVVLMIAAAGAQEGAGQTVRERIRERVEQPRRAKPPAVTEPSPATAFVAGDQVRTLAHGGQQRLYLIHVPPGLDQSRPAPLVVALHGGGGHAEYMADDSRYGLIGAADRNGFIVVFPNGDSRFPAAGWPPGMPAAAARRSA